MAVDLSAHPYAKAGELKVTQPVVVRVSIYWMQSSAGPISEYDDKTGTSTTVTHLFGDPNKPLPRFGDLNMNTPSPAIFKPGQPGKKGTIQWTGTLGLGASNVQCNLTVYNELTTITNQHVGVKSGTTVNLYVLNIATPSANIFLTPGNADANALDTYKQAFLNIQLCLDKKDNDLKTLLNSFLPRVTR